jgi:hypothetical protein
MDDAEEKPGAARRGGKQMEQESDCFFVLLCGCRAVA